jgi:transcriptional regulator with XRE-family HTH domain
MNRIAQLRNERHMSQADLAKELGVHQTAVSQWENGRTSPSFETLTDLCSYFDVDLYFLLGHTDVRGRFHMGEQEQEDLDRSAAEDAMYETFEAYKALDEFGKMAVEELIRLEHHRMRCQNIKPYWTDSNKDGE